MRCPDKTATSLKSSAFGSYPKRAVLLNFKKKYEPTVIQSRPRLTLFLYRAENYEDNVDQDIGELEKQYMYKPCLIYLTQKTQYSNRQVRMKEERECIICTDVNTRLRMSGNTVVQQDVMLPKMAMWD